MSKCRIKWMTDTTSDLPPELAKEWGIDVQAIPIAVDGKGYVETDFTPQEFYKVLMRSKEIPVTSRISVDTFLEAYRRAAQEGYTDLINVTINAKGSSTNESALMARQMFLEKEPELASRMSIHVIDSRTYSFGYGHVVLEGARRTAGGMEVDEALAFVRDWVCSAQVFLACYTLDFAKKSGRISSTAAFVGEMLGLRPIIHMVDGDNKVIEKVRGDKNVVPAVCARACEALAQGGEYYIMKGMLDEPAQELAAMMTKATGYAPLGVHSLGPSVSINAGPKVVAAVIRGRKRR